MPRLVSVALLALVVLLTAAGLVWYFAYGLDEQPPSRAAVAALGAPAEVAWHEGGAASITAASEADAYAALGFVHGQARTWTVALWRQTALGALGAWFGPGVLPLDGFVRRIGLPDAARAAYEALPEEERALLEAYARGMNAALAGRHAHTDEGFARLDLAPEPWAPWHTLAVERLYAWLATTPPSADTLAAAGADAEAFYETDRRLRDWLHVYGLENSIAWAVRDSAGTHFFQRHVHGASTLPLYQEVRLTWEGGPLVTGLSLPGTPFFPSGTTADRAWAFFPTGTVRLFETPDTSYARRYARLETTDGTEYLASFRRTQGALLFEPPDRPAPPPDTLRATPADSLAPLAGAPADTTTVEEATTWALAWAGLGAASDVAAWRGLLLGEPVAFRLASGFGMEVGPAGAATVLGDPAVVVPLGDGLFVGGAPYTRFAALRLDSLRAGRANPRTWPDDTYSPWAAELGASLVASVDSIQGLEAPPLVTDALTYLRNWDYRYTRTSIAATILDTWVTAYRDSTGRLPDVVPPDTVFFENQRRYAALVSAVRTLRRAYGDELSAWRWENVLPDERAFPVWSVDTLLAQRPAHLARTHYAPIQIPSLGHPTALAWGSSPVFLDVPAPTAVEAWIASPAWDALEIRQRRFDLDRFLGRYRILRRRPDFALPFAEPTGRTTILRPAVTSDGA